MELEKIFVANGGLCAYKFLVDHYESNRKCIFIGMVRPCDLKNKMKYINFLQQYEIVPDGLPENNFNNLELVVSLAQKYSVDYLWAGYGHLSENHLLPKALEKLNIKFIGPSSKSMEVLANKISATSLARDLRIPTIPFAIIRRKEDMHDFAAKHDYPFMVRNANEGGGRGITMIKTRKDLEDYEFRGNENLYITKFLTDLRHIEIQGIGDRRGQYVTLGTRDCTLQRRYQKLMEEAPQIICSPDTIEGMERNSIELLRAVQYEGLATIEWIYDVSTKKYYFLEVNCRLQVEHPCTEILYGIKLPVIQLEIARGKSLADYNFTQRNLHVISIRVLAEDDRFLPQSGRVSVQYSPFRFAKYYFALMDGKIDNNSDSQFGHIFVKGRTRRQALKNLFRTIEHVHVEGINSSLDFCMNALTDKNYIRNNFYTTCAEFMLCNGILQNVNFFSIVHSLAKNKDSLDFIYEDENFSSSIIFLKKNRLVCQLNNTYTYHTYEKIASNIIHIDGEKIEYEIFTDFFRITYRRRIFNAYFNREIQIAKNSFKLKKYYAESGQYIKKGDRLILAEAMKTEMSICAPFDGIFEKIKKENEFVEKNEKYCIIKNRKEEKNTYLMKIEISDSTLSELTIESIGSFFLPEALFRFSSEYKYFEFLKKIDRIKNELAFSEYVKKYIAFFKADAITRKIICDLYIKSSKNISGLNILYGDIKMNFSMHKRRKNYCIKIPKNNLIEALAYIKSKGRRSLNITLEEDVDHSVFDYIESIRKIQVVCRNTRIIYRNDFSEKLIFRNNHLVGYEIFGREIFLNNEIRRFLKRENNFDRSLNIFLILLYEQKWKIKISELYFKNGVLTKKKERTICGIRGYLVEIEAFRIVFIINDRKFINGSLGRDELIFYSILTDYAVEINAMRIFIANNSGVRISVDEHFLNNFSVLKSDTSYKIKTGSTNLSYAALACKATISARGRIPLISYVHNMSVGIGAYLAKLGGQIIMEKESFLILTGFRALNKLVQAEQYKSNKELGGSSIMISNNICQKEVSNLLGGMVYVLKYIQYLYFPEKNTSTLFNGLREEHELVECITRNTFFEFSEHFCSGIKTGRGIINGRCFGIIYPTRPNVINGEGAIKMTRALSFFDSEKIPTLIIGNFKGFTGDGVEMSKGILTFGADLLSMIERYAHRMFVYIPSFATMRGGSYVIFDKMLNNNIFMICNKKARIGILDEDGLRNVKKKTFANFDDKLISEYIDRLDDPINFLREGLIDEICESREVVEIISKNL